MSTIWIVTYNYDWNESTEAHATRDKAIKSIAENFECQAEPDTPAFWQEVMDNYEAGKWKGFQFITLNTETLAIDAADQVCGADDDFTYGDWQEAVRQGDTRRGYEDWRDAQREQAMHKAKMAC